MLNIHTFLKGGNQFGSQPVHPSTPKHHCELVAGKTLFSLIITIMTLNTPELEKLTSERRGWGVTPAAWQPVSGSGAGLAPQVSSAAGEFRPPGGGPD